MYQLVINGLLHFQVVSHTDHSQGLLASVLRVLLHALATNHSTSFLQHLFAVQVWLETGSGSVAKAMLLLPLRVMQITKTDKIVTWLDCPTTGNTGS